MKNSETKMEYSSESWIDPRIEIKYSPLYGKGMYALSPLINKRIARLNK